VQDGSSGRDIIGAENHAGRQYIFFSIFFTQFRSQISHLGQRSGTSRKQRPIPVDSGGRSNQFPGSGGRSRPKPPLPARGGAETDAGSIPGDRWRAETERILGRAETERDRVRGCSRWRAEGRSGRRKQRPGRGRSKTRGSRAGDRRPPRDGAYDAVEEGRPPGDGADQRRASTKGRPRETNGDEEDDGGKKWKLIHTSCRCVRRETLAGL
jgi:hypothetical protein